MRTKLLMVAALAGGACKSDPSVSRARATEIEALADGAQARLEARPCANPAYRELTWPEDGGLTAPYAAAKDQLARARELGATSPGEGLRVAIDAIGDALERQRCTPSLAQTMVMAASIGEAAVVVEELAPRASADERAAATRAVDAHLARVPTGHDILTGERDYALHVLIRPVLRGEPGAARAAMPKDRDAALVEIDAAMRLTERAVVACPAGTTVEACTAALEALDDEPGEYARLMASFAERLAKLRAARDALAGA